jgi:Flp pilus assembly pilin Flp
VVANTVRDGIKKFFRSLDDLGQDVAEYCLLTALIALIGLGILYRVSGGMQNLWGNANSTLGQGNSATSDPASGSSASGSHPTR